MVGDTYCDDGAEVSASYAAAAEEATGEDERTDSVERDADWIDWHSDETRVTGRLGADDDSECDQRQPCKLRHGHARYPYSGASTQTKK